MKWLVTSVCLVFMAGAVGAHYGHGSNVSESENVDAPTQNNVELPEPGTTPGSPFFGLEQAQESIGLALTFNSEKKAHKRLQMAQERLSEAKKLSEDNDSTNAEKAVQMHSSAMERADQAVQNLPEDRRGNASQELNNTRSQSISVLEDLKQRLPESAMNGIETAIKAHQKKEVGNKSGRQGTSQNRTETPPNPEVESDGYKATSRVIRES